MSEDDCRDRPGEDRPRDALLRAPRPRYPARAEEIWTRLSRGEQAKGPKEPGPVPSGRSEVLSATQAPA